MLDQILQVLGGNGSLRIGDTSAHARVHRVILVREDATEIGALAEYGINDALAEHGLTGESLNEGEVIVASNKFTSITLTSGSVTIY